jgi:hypothetical protein
MQTVAEVIAVWPTAAELARDLGVPYPTVAAWRQRGSIRPEYWHDIVRAAQRRGHPEITAELLVRIHARKPGRVRPTGFAEEEPSRPHPRTAGGTIPAAGASPAIGIGHFSRFKHLRRAHFASSEEIVAHIRALRDEWDRQ